MVNFQNPDRFVNRHIGPDETEIKEMLEVIGVSSLDELIDQTVPAHIRNNNELNLDEPLSEFDFIKGLKETASRNKIFKSYIGMGYYPSVTPPVIQRNILENPGWYTQYTPYQAEISQGRLEALINFQTMVSDLTSMEIANASLLDEGTAAAEAMLMFNHHKAPGKKEANTILVSKDCFPQTIDVIKTRALPVGIEVRLADITESDMTEDVFAIIVQYPDSNGDIIDYKKLFEDAASKNIFIIAAADIMSLTLIVPPGEIGADAVVGSTQRFGIPMGYGGPHAAYFATKEKFKRNIPGRLIGISIDADGNKAYRMALQTREQHIKREKATSNICTAQVLLAVMAGMYSVYHGPKILRQIAERIHALTVLLDHSLKKLGLVQKNKIYFDTLKIDMSDRKDNINDLKNIAESHKINFRYFDDAVGISINELSELNDIQEIVNVFSEFLKVNSVDINSINIES